MGERKVGFDRATLDMKILLDDDRFLVMPAIIASEIVHKYENGWAYKPAVELEKTAWTADGRWVTILKHPDTALLQKASDIYGRIEEPRFAKDLLEPKTKRPMRKGIRAKIKWFKDRVPESVISQIRSGDLKDVSIGFTYEEDLTPGKWNEQPYDFVQRNIFIDHVAAPIPEGRCPGPICGIAVDSVVNTKVGLDPFAQYESFEDCISKNQDKSDPEAYCATIKRKTEDAEDMIRIPLGAQCDAPSTVSISEDQGIQAVICGEDKVISAYLFSTEKGWTMEKAEEWIGGHKAMGLDEVIAANKCDICAEIKRVGLVRASYRLKKRYGQDVLNVIKGEQLPKPASQEQSIEDLLLHYQKVRDSARWLFQ